MEGVVKHKEFIEVSLNTAVPSKQSRRPVFWGHRGTQWRWM